MLVHICCAVDSHFFLQKLRQLYPHEKLIGFFYDPNIHPYSEYKLRLLDVQRSCKKLGIKLIEGEYNYRGWLDAVRGYEDEPEKGLRCELCFDDRLKESARKAVELGERYLTTTLLTSPKKSKEQLKNTGMDIQKEFGVEFVYPDFRKNGGTQEQFLMAKHEKIYHQDYCGCIYALTKQRNMQKRVADELFSSVGKQILPESIEERLLLYQKRLDLEDKKIDYHIVRNKFLNYRLLRAFLEENKKVIPSYVVHFSVLKRENTKFKIFSKIEDIYLANRENIRLISLKTFNKLLDKNYQNIEDIVFNPPLVEEEIALRNKIIESFYSLSPILVIKNIEQKSSYKLYLNAQLYEDTRESLVTFR